MVRQAHHERLKLMALKLRLGNPYLTSSSLPILREAGASKNPFPSWSLGTSKKSNVIKSRLSMRAPSPPYGFCQKEHCWSRSVTRQDALMGVSCRVFALLGAIIVFACPMDVIAGESPVKSPTIKKSQNSNTPSQLPQVRQPVNDMGGPGSGIVGNSNDNSDPLLPTPDRDPNACTDEHGDLAPAMVVLPPGHFLMGTPKDEQGRNTREGPQHWVTLRKPFAMGRCEITVAQFRRFVEETGYVTEAEKPDGEGCSIGTLAVGKFPRNSDLVKFEQRKGIGWRQPGFPQTDQHPVVCVSHGDALAYADWLSLRTGGHYRLPTEAEWEYAVRSTPTLERYRVTARYWGEDSVGKQQCDYANGADKSAQSISGKEKTLADQQFSL